MRDCVAGASARVTQNVTYLYVRSYRWNGRARLTSCALRQVINGGGDGDAVVEIDVTRGGRSVGSVLLRTARTSGLAFRVRVAFPPDEDWVEWCSDAGEGDRDEAV